jgi:hypothetical protein
MKRQFLFPPGAFPAAANSPLSLWRVVHLRRLDLTLAIYRTCTLLEKQRLWPQARNALSEGPRKRISSLQKLQRPLSHLLGLLKRRPVRRGALK